MMAGGFADWKMGTHVRGHQQTRARTTALAEGATGEGDCARDSRRLPALLHWGLGG